jgi:hypothetical protein
MEVEDTGAYKHGFADGRKGYPNVAMDGVWRYARDWTDDARYKKGFEAGKRAKIEEMNRHDPDP